VKCAHGRPRFICRASIPACAIRLNVEDERTPSDLACDSRSRALWTRAAINADRIGTTKGSMRKLIVSEFISLDGVIQGGKRLLPNGLHQTFNLTAATSYPSGVVRLHYKRQRGTA
jgi:hypothetical protein